MSKVTNTTNDPRPDWLLGLNPGAIENQEAQGQKELIESQQLPIKPGSYIPETAREQYTKMGIKVIGESQGDNLFFDVELPKGWKKQATDHSMWNNLVDDKGRVRAMFFYKAAFYDRSAHVQFKSRYQIESDYSNDNERAQFVKDTGTGTVIFRTKSVPKSEYYEKDQALREECNQFLDTNFPDYKDINAYWD